MSDGIAGQRIAEAFERIADKQKALQDAAQALRAEQVALMTTVFDDVAAQIASIIDNSINKEKWAAYDQGMRWCVELERTEGASEMRIALHQMVDGGMAPLIRSDTGNPVAIEVAYRPEQDHENITITHCDDGHQYGVPMMKWLESQKPVTYETDLFYNLSSDVKEYCVRAYSGYFQGFVPSVRLVQRSLIAGAPDAPTRALRAA